MRIRGKPAIMCFDSGVLGESIPSLLNQSKGTSEPREADGALVDGPILGFSGGPMLRGRRGPRLKRAQH